MSKENSNYESINGRSAKHFGFRVN